MNMPRIESVRFRLPQGRPGYIIARLEDGRELRFRSGEMLAEMKRLRIMRLKVAIIHNMAFEKATSISRNPSLGVLELLAEFRLAAEEFGVTIGEESRNGTSD